MEDTQLMKGILEGCILGVIYQGETYGYEILSILEGGVLACQTVKSKNKKAYVYNYSKVYTYAFTGYLI